MNAVLISVLVMLVLSLSRINVVMAIIISTFTAGLIGGLGWNGTLNTFLGSIGNNANIALSYALLGSLTVAIAHTGLMKLLVNWLLNNLKGKRGFLLLSIAFIASLSQNLVPVHIAFIPLLIPPMLSLFNRLKIDRRAVAVALTFGLTAPYMLIPAGFGLVYHQIIQDNLAVNGLQVSLEQIPQAMVLPVLGLFLGLLIAIFFSYRKSRAYEDLIIDSSEPETVKFNKTHVVALIAIIAALIFQILTDSMIIGAMIGLIIMYLLGAVRLKEADSLFIKGIKMMSFIGFVMLVAGGYASVIKATGDVESLVNTSTLLVGDNKALAALVMLLLGLVITMGIGTSFGTVPIIATIYVPLAGALGFSSLATIALIGTAGALGDAGSPASDSTLGPTSGLNADGQHDHIWGTVVPTFLHFNLPLIVFGWIAAMIL